MARRAELFSRPAFTRMSTCHGFIIYLTCNYNYCVRIEDADRSAVTKHDCSVLHFFLLISLSHRSPPWNKHNRLSLYHNVQNGLKSWSVGATIFRQFDISLLYWFLCHQTFRATANMRYNSKLFIAVTARPLRYNVTACDSHSGNSRSNNREFPHLQLRSRVSIRHRIRNSRV